MLRNTFINSKEPEGPPVLDEDERQGQPAGGAAISTGACAGIEVRVVYH